MFGCIQRVNIKYNNIHLSTHIKLFLVVGHGLIGDEGGKVGHVDLPFLDLLQTDVVDVLLQGRRYPPLYFSFSLIIV